MTDILTAEPAAGLTADRSTVERYETCPAQAAFVAQGRVITGSHETSIGDAAHEALGGVTTEYVASRGNMSITDLVDYGMQLLCASRPDVQHDAIGAVRPSLWAFAKYLQGLHWQNVLRWDGGEGEHCGQLAWDIPDLGVRVTSEVDLVHTGRATELLTEIDYKSGRKLHTAASVERSFQFAMHAWLLLENYPDVQAVLIRVWNTRRNDLTYGVTWKRADLYELQYRIRASVTNWLRYRDKEPHTVPTWPEEEKCAWCPAAALCTAVPMEIQGLVSDPSRLVDVMVAQQAKLAALEKLADGVVASTGRDIFSSSGAAYGVCKPKTERKPKRVLYQVKANDSEDDGDAAH